MICEVKYCYREANHVLTEKFERFENENGFSVDIHLCEIHALKASKSDVTHYHLEENTMLA